MDFANRHHIQLPLLADADSKVIRSFNVVNAEAKGMTKGMAHPGFFYIDENGVIRETYFEVKYTDRFTANNVIGKLFPELAQKVSESVEAPHLGLTLSQSDRTVVPGSRVTLIAEIELPPDVHVYAPGAKGYRPIQLVLTKSEGFESGPVSYPNSKMLYFEPISGAGASLRGQISHHPGCHDGFFEGRRWRASAAFIGEERCDCRRAALSGLHQHTLLPTYVSAGKMGVEG